MDDRSQKRLDWLPELMEKVRTHLTMLENGEPDIRQALESELAQLDEQAKGYLQSLGNPNLPAELRTQIEGMWQQVAARKREIEQDLRQDSHRQQRLVELLQPADVFERLEHLADVLAENNPTMGNFELSMHVDRIVCYPDGHLEMRTCKLGALAGAADLIADTSSPTSVGEAPEQSQAAGAGPRRRTRLRVHDPDTSRSQLQAAADFAADPNRFAGLSDEWFWVDAFHLPVTKSWASENAQAVQARYDELWRQLGRRPSLNVLAAEFGKSRPTITAALKAAQPDTEPVETKPKDCDGPTVDAKSLADEFARLEREEGVQLAAIAKRFGVHRNTVARVLKKWYLDHGLVREDGRSLRWHRAVQ